MLCTWLTQLTLEEDLESVKVAISAKYNPFEQAKQSYYAIAAAAAIIKYRAYSEC